MNTLKAASPYDQKFFASVHAGAHRSAEAVLGLLYNLHTPASVFDLGCGSGAWLAVAESLGSERLVGWDGPWVKSTDLESRTIEFLPVNMQGGASRYSGEPKGLPVPPSVDLAMSLEVAEHLTSDRADDIVRTLCAASGVVIFSAAIPHQGGVNHVNEQPQSYWIEKFEARGYTCFDFFRPKLWNDESVEWWYRANTFLFIHPSHPLHSRISRESDMPRNVVHPTMVECMAAKTYRAPSLAACVRIFARWAKGKFWAK